MAENIRDLMDQRASAVTAMRALVDAAEAENRDLTQEEQNTYEQHNADVDALGARIARAQRMQSLEAEQRESANGGSGNPALRQPTAQRGQDASDSAEYRSAMARYLFSGQGDQILRIDNRNDAMSPELRAVLGVSLGGTGAVMAPAQLERSLLKDIADINVMRGLASVRSSNSDVEIPYTSTHATVYRIAEGADFTASTPALNKITMGAYKVGALAYVTHEAMEDMLLDVDQWVRDEFARGFAEFEEDEFINGTGTGQPEGILTGGTLGVTAAAQAAITTNEILDLLYSVKAGYREKGVFVINDATALAIRKLKDQNGQYLWQPSLQLGQPDMLFGKRVYYSAKMPAIEASAKAIAFGDMSQYRILDRRGLFFQRLNEVAATSGQVGFLAYRRYDAKVLKSDAIKYLSMAAASGGSPT